MKPNLNGINLSGKGITKLEIVDFNLIAHGVKTKIYSLQGITILFCDDNELTSIPYLSGLVGLDCSNNKLLSSRITRHVKEIKLCW